MTAVTTPEFQEEWMAIIAVAVCAACGRHGADGEFNWTAGTPPAYARLNCACGAFIRWLPAPKNIGKRSDTSKARAFWKRHDGGLLLCSVCGAREGDNPYIRITIHHRERVEDNPAREHDLYNTVPLCADCHTVAEALRNLRRHSAGQSARES